MALKDNASLALIPAAYKQSKVYSVLPTNGNGDFDFTRSGNATRVNKGGYIETVGSNIPRLDYPLIDGVVQDCPTLLLEPSRTNSLPYSLEYDNNTYYTKTNSTITTQSGVSPDGSNTAYKLQDTNDTGATSHFIQQASGYRATIAYNAIKSASVFVKAGTKKQVQVRLANGSGSFSYIMGNFDLENETILTGANANASNISYELQNYGNGWYRCIVKGSWNLSNVTQSLVQVFTADTSLTALPNIHNYQGDGTGTLFVWGQMIEAGSYPTSYISTSGSAVTRNAETCNGAGTSDTFNDSEGVLFAEIAVLEGDTSVVQLSLSNGTDNENIKLLQLNSTTVRAEVKMSAGSNFVEDITIDAELFNKYGIQYKADNYKVFVNGFAQSVNQRSTTPSGLNTLNFDRGDGNSDFYGNTKQLMTFNTALTDSELEQVTSWTSFNEMAKGQLYTIE